MKGATRELLASRADVWSFLAEPYHLSDWWPGVQSVEPDRRGFAVGARWQISAISDPPRIGLLRFPRMGRPSGPLSAQMLVITRIDLLERWEWQLIRRVPVGRERTVAHREVEIVLRTLDEERTEVTVTVASGGIAEPRLAETAVKRLYDLVQTAGSL